MNNMIQDVNVLAIFGDGNSTLPELLKEIEGFQNCRKVIELKQIHSSHVVIVNDLHKVSQQPPAADALVTNLPGVALTIRTADCFPVFFWDTKNRVIAAAHSGREGTKKNIVQETLNEMKKLGADTAVIRAAIGPGISGRYYKVDKATWEDFCRITRISQNYPFLDLKKVILAQMQQAGISSSNIIDKFAFCTYADENYCSYRRANTTERQFSVIIMKA